MQPLCRILEVNASNAQLHCNVENKPENKERYSRNAYTNLTTNFYFLEDTIFKFRLENEFV